MKFFFLPTQPNNSERWGKEQNPSSSQFSKAARLRQWGRQLGLWFCLIFFSMLSYCLCQQFIITSVVVEGKSMLPTLQEGDYCLLNRWTYRRRDPERGDLVVLRDPGHTDFAVKRVVGLPGETISFSQGKVFVNNVVLLEPYIKPGPRTMPPQNRDKVIVLGKEEYYVLGDNRAVSEDSRMYGPISRGRIAGQLTFR